MKRASVRSALDKRHSHYLQVLYRTAANWKITDDMIMDERALP